MYVGGTTDDKSTDDESKQFEEYILQPRSIFVVMLFSATRFRGRIEYVQQYSAVFGGITFTLCLEPIHTHYTSYNGATNLQQYIQYTQIEPTSNPCSG